MQPAQEQYDVGVIVGRFQVHELHDAHRDLIQYVCDQHEKVVIFLGLSPLMVSSNNPLDFESRKQMILAEFPDANVLYIKDQPSDEVWSRKLDEMVGDVLTPSQSCVLYGGRDSFIEHYTGRYPTRELVQSQFFSGTAQRKAIARSRAKASPEFRAGVIWASQSRFPTAYTTVDVAIFKRSDRMTCSGPGDGYLTTKILLGRKPNESLYRLPGGFSDPTTPSFEQDARREAAEETGVEIGDLRYIGSRVQEDWRYRNEPDCIKTMLFTAKYVFGRPTPGDDIEEVRWFDFPVRPELVVPAHRPLMAMLTEKEGA